MALLTSTGAGILKPEDVAELVVRPVQQMSVLYQACQTVVIGSHDYRFPILAEDPSAAWVLEGQEIPVDDPVVTELVVTPAKVAGLTVISRELANDGLENASAAEVVGRAIARDIAKAVDRAAFAPAATPVTNAPAPLAALAGVSVVDVTPPLGNSDAFAEGQSLAEQAGAVLTSWIASPANALALAKLKEDPTSNRLLLEPDPTLPSRRMIHGVPLLVSPALDDSIIWGLARDFSYVVQHDRAALDIDSSPFFTSDRIAIRGTLRLAWGFPHPAAVVKITV